MTFELALRSAGLLPRAKDIAADGRIHRCPTEAKPRSDAGWFVLHADGHGVFGDWSTGSSEPTGYWQDEHAQHVDRAELDRRMADQRRAQRDEQLAAMRRARELWARCRPLNRLHPYISAKGLSPLGCAGLREHDGLLVVPVWRGEWMVSLQTIAPDGTKRFAYGAPVRAGSYIIDRPRAALTVICEGLATGLALYQSIRHARVVVAFNAGNLLPVVELLKPTGSVVIAGDNDHGTKEKRGFNPGIEKAENAAELIGCGVWWPKGIEGTDAADWLREIGGNAGKQLERQVIAAARYVLPTAAAP